MKKMFALLMGLTAWFTVLGGIGVFAYDVPSSWAAEEVGRAVNAGFVPEELQKEYGAPVTRKEFAKLGVLFAMHELGYGSLEAFSTVMTTVSGPTSFLDTDDPYVILAAQMSVTNGAYNGFFDGDRSITRKEAAAMLNRLFESYSYIEGLPSVSFADVDEEDWGYRNIRWCVGRNVMRGVSDTHFDPEGTYTREQAIVTFARMDAIEGWEKWNRSAKIRRKISIDDAISEMFAEGGEPLARYDTGDYGTVIYVKGAVMPGNERYTFCLVGNDGKSHLLGSVPVLNRMGKTPPATQIALLEYNSVLYYEIRYEAHMLGADSQVKVPGTYKVWANLMTLEIKSEFVKDSQ